MKRSRSLEVGIDQPHRFFRPSGAGQSYDTWGPRLTPGAAFFRRFASIPPVRDYSFRLVRCRTGCGICAIFTGALHNRAPFERFSCRNEFSENPRRAWLLERAALGAAPFPVRGLWMACTWLKRRVLTNAYFSLTHKIEGVQQDRSLTAS
jgi:hypothetical protein